MGYTFIMGHCYTCKNLFTFHPHKVPSIRIKGTKEPICKACMLAANSKRKALNLDPHPINPDAYEACEEYEL